MRIEGRGPRFAILRYIEARPHPLPLAEIVLKFLKSTFWGLISAKDDLRVFSPSKQNRTYKACKSF